VPVTYRIAADRRTIRTACTGEVTLQEVIDHLRKLQQDPECPSELKKIHSKVSFDACAILAQSPISFRNDANV
jgi:hypothetical protein